MLYLIPESPFLPDTTPGRRTTSDIEAKKYNEMGYGVFTTPNLFEGKTLISNLKEVRFCFFEIDGIPKDEQRSRIDSSPVRPSMIIESKNSYHVYFRVKDFDELKFKKIQNGLINYFDSDIKIKNVNRFMRVPGYKHLKNPDEPFEIKLIHKNDNVYTFETLKEHFPYFQEIPTPVIFDCNLEDIPGLISFLNKNVDSETQLLKLSGTPFVNYETYSFRVNAGGTKQILVNGKSTSCFIDKAGLIGATHGPTVWQWLGYFKHSPGEIRRIIREVFNV